MTAAGFRTRKVKVEQSLGDRLKRARTRKKITVAEVEEQTKIRAKFILALESDSWDQIPSEVYGRGYLEAYADYLQLPVDEMMKQYHLSRATYWRKNGKEVVDLAPVSRMKTNRFVVTPKLFTATFVVCAVLIFIGVIGYQITRFTAAPFLELATPAQAREVGTSQLELFTETFNGNGRTTVGATVTVNGQPVAVMQDGAFTYQVPVQKGVNAIVVAATNLAGNTTTETLTVTVK
jgi:cytoskeletal protein RodZ